MVYRYSKYIMQNLASSAVLITLALCSIVWLTQALRYIDFIVNRGVSISMFAYLTSLLFPPLMLLVLPMALFAAVMFFYHKLKTDSELVVLSGAGLSRLQLARPALTVAMGAALFGYVLSLYLLPMTNRQFKDLEVFLKNNYASLLLQEEVFNSPVDELTVFIRERDNRGILHGIFVHDSRQRGRPITMMAEQGKLIQTAQGPQFILAHGNRQEMRDGRLSVLYFDNYTLDLSVYAQGATNRTREADERFLPDLLSPEPDVSEQERSKMWAEAHQRIVWPLYNIALTLLALATLVPGEFNRRGQWKRITLASVIGFAVTLGGLGLSSTVAKYSVLWPFMYLNVAGVMLASLYVLTHEGQRAPFKNREAV